MLRKLFYKIFPTYVETDVQFVSYCAADKMLGSNENKPEAEKWVLSEREDYNTMVGMVYLCKKVRK